MPRIPVWIFSPALLLMLSACNAPLPAPLKVKTEPSGALVFVDGSPVGKSPQNLSLDVTDPNRMKRKIRVEMAGFEPAEAEPHWVSDTHIMTPVEAGKNICCAPCCCFLPLLNFLQPVNTSKKFEPSELFFKLKPLGEGIILTLIPPSELGEWSASVLVDGVLAGQVSSRMELEQTKPPSMEEISKRGGSWTSSMNRSSVASV